VASESSEPLLQLGVAPDASAVQVVWHPRIKQVVCGTSAGVTKVLYDPLMSNKGALMSASRVKRAKDPSDVFGSGPGIVGEIHNPHALPMFQTEARGKRKLAKDRMDPAKSRKPDMPMTGPGAPGAKKVRNTNFTAFVMQSHTKNPLRDQDAREEILKYAVPEGTGTNLVGRAYANTAPKPVLQEKTLEQEQEDMAKMEEEILKR
jgi:WD repeat-containing protein 70